MKYDYLIVGAGLSGATVAQSLVSRGKRCLVIESREIAGGLAATQTVNGITVHNFGAHIFHTSNANVWKYVNNFAELKKTNFSPLAAYRGKLYSLPLGMRTFYELWGVKSPSEARAIIAAQTKACAGQARNFEEKALSLVGEDVYKTLVKGYTEKLWGKDCRFLPSSIIKDIPTRFTFDCAFLRGRYQAVPIDGYTNMINRMLVGAEVVTGADYFSDKASFDKMANAVVYTGAIDRFFGFDLGELEYIRLRFETQILDCADFQGSAAVYYTEYDVPYAQIIEHKHISEEPCKNTVVTYAYPDKNGRGSERLFAINDKRNRELYARYGARAKREKNVVFCGRLAEYKNYRMDKAIAHALDVAKKL